MKPGSDIHHMTHVAELLWISVWLVAGVVYLVGVNTVFGERSVWQIIFGFLF